MKVKVEYDELQGYITASFTEYDEFRILDYADDWNLASEKEKKIIRLVATAPQLLEALEKICDLAVTNLENPTLFVIKKIAFDVIKKARGTL